jgi:hypothetical protein
MIAMPRIHFVELHEQPWFPAMLRNEITGALQVRVRGLRILFLNFRNASAGTWRHSEQLDCGSVFWEWGTMVRPFSKASRGYALSHLAHRQIPEPYGIREHQGCVREWYQCP